MIGVGAVITKDEHVLLVRRLGQPGKGTWSIPGGLVGVGERVTEAVVREVKEETGLEVEVKNLIDVVDRILRDEGGKVKYHYVILDYSVEILGGEAHPSSDVSEARWVPFKDLKRYNLSKSVMACLGRVGIKVRVVDKEESDKRNNFRH